LTAAPVLAARARGAAAPYHGRMTRHRSFALFATALGACAIAWNDVGVTAVWLPESDADALRRKVVRSARGAVEAVPDGRLGEVVAAIVRLLAGAPVDLAWVPLDDSHLDDFDRRVYAVARAIAPGRVLTYGEVAARVGADASARAVGAALGRNAMPIIVPCHRVVATGGLGGFSAPGGTATKRRLLAIEDARADGPPDLFDCAASTSGSNAALTSERGAGVRR
jgi:methylated-DNA-[protein]-cysteine S-methyltransferase